MSPNWRWCLKIGAVVVLVDLLTLALVRDQAAESELRAVLDAVDQVLNIMLFSYVGYRTGRETGRATAAAEAGVVASLLPALVAAIYQIVQPAEGAAVGVPLANRLIGSVAFNIVLGGVSAWLTGWVASRSRTAAG